jgi:hypothetical protein
VIRVATSDALHLAMALKDTPLASLARPRKGMPNQKLVLNSTDATTTRITPTKERVDRTSFSSIKESNTGIAQSFTTSKTSSYLRNEYSSIEDAIEDEDSSGSRTPEIESVGMLTNPQSILQPFVCPCNGFRGWKGINIGGRVASKSFGDLKALNRWEWAPVKQDPNQMDIDSDRSKENKTVDGRHRTGESPLESLPVELLSMYLFHPWSTINIPQPSKFPVGICSSVHIIELC